MELTEGTLLGGRVRYRQPLHGYRTGIEPVLLAASVPAKAGERVIEAGTGAGAGLLCLMARVAGVTVIGIERDDALARLAEDNIRENAYTTAQVVAADVQHLPSMPLFDHAMANPPWHDEQSPPSPDALRQTAKRAKQGLIASWAASLSQCLRPGGSLTIILPAGSIPLALAGTQAAGCGSPALLPLWPRPGQSARLVMLQILKDRRGPCRVLPGLVLHDECGFSAEARAILWEGQRLTWSA